MIEKKHYTEEFYNDHQEGSYISAQEILEYVNDIFHPHSVVDVGCGVGYWLKVWNEKFKIKDVFGLEGPYITESMLKIPGEFVQFLDLKKPFNLNRKFDLAMSLEVAEHLPESCSDSFIQSLTQLSDVILFSAAIIGQEGTYHINEQMPEYWAKKFKKYNYVPIDYLRPKIWTNEKIDWWYRQNILIYLKQDRVGEYPMLKRAYETTSAENLFRIQPWLYLYKLKRIQKTESIGSFILWKLYPVKKFFQKIFKK